VLSGGRTPLYLSQKDTYIEKEMIIISEVKKNNRLLRVVFLEIKSTNFVFIAV
jgi:hypothetical protein